METAAHACTPCKKGKRRCDKILPSCSLCERIGRPCDYSIPSPSADGPPSLRSRILQLEQLVAWLSDQLPSTVQVSAGSTDSDDVATTTTLVADADTDASNTYSQCLFLDSTLSEYCDIPDNEGGFTIPPELLAAVGDRLGIEQTVTEYFQSVNVWMPIISKAKLDRLIKTGTQNQNPRADLALLLLSLKLVLEVPKGGNAGQSWLYTTAKRFCAELEIEGVCSLIKLQASLIIAVYELGHAIFPAAYTSIGNCARHGISLGLHNKLAPQMLRRARGWVDWEERQRVWWFIIVLDRYVTIGSDYRSLCTEDPTPDMYIPTNDAAWEQGEIVPPERVSLSSPTSISVSPFARVAQASNLLGRVIRHCNDRTSSPAFMLDNMELLHQTTSSLIVLLTDDPSIADSFYLAHAVCLSALTFVSALMKLDGHHTCDSYDDDRPVPIETAAVFRESMDRAIIKIREDSTRVVYFVESLMNQIRDSGLDGISPLVMHCVYRAAVALSFGANESEERHYINGQAICEELLRTMNTRWKAAGIDSHGDCH
ncbi:fungal-specific transcription factor domain protein [Xylogone sp. PMI_703]|nr:fungal-specific transcription factor domain protein [Xylogone sp. PMI_703]